MIIIVYLCSIVCIPILSVVQNVCRCDANAKLVNTWDGKMLWYIISFGQWSHNLGNYLLDIINVEINKILKLLQKNHFCFFENFLLVLQNYALLKLEEMKDRSI